jgi:pimeloyl-ACP methyl ester carboxylesterase
MSTMPFVQSGVELAGYEFGAGFPVIFQHGLGGDASQVAEVFPDGPTIRRLTLECRSQGASKPGPFDLLSIKTFADDVLAFAGSRGIEKFVVGGISMGAAIALRIAVIAPERVRGLIISRPAWLWNSAPENMKPFGEVATYLTRADLAAAKDEFERSETGILLARHAPDNLASLLKFFSVPEPIATAQLLERISVDGPGVTLEQVRALRMPTLVIAHGFDAVHPLDYGRAIAAEIGGAIFAEITSKVESKARYVEDFRSALKAFLDDCLSEKLQFRNDGSRN